MKMSAEEYGRRVRRVGPPSPLGGDCLWAFGVGGGICLLGEVLRGVSRHYRALDPDAPAPADPALLNDIDAAIDDLAASPRAVIRREAVLALVSLRRNLFPLAQEYRSVTS